MTTALKLNLVAAVSGYVRGANDQAAPQQNYDLANRLALAFGTNAGQADIVFSDTRTLAASATESLDLSGVLTDAFGAVIACVEVVAVLILPSATNTNDLWVGGAAANAFPLFKDVTDIAVVKPGGILMIAAPTNPAYPVTAATGDLLKIANAAGVTPVDYTILIVGRSA